MGALVVTDAVVVGVYIVLALVVTHAALVHVYIIPSIADGTPVVAHPIAVLIHIALGGTVGGVTHSGFLAAAEAVALGRGEGGHGAHREKGGPCHQTCNKF